MGLFVFIGHIISFGIKLSYAEGIAAHNGKLLPAPRLKPDKLTRESSLLVVNSVAKLADFRYMPRSALKVKRLNYDVAGTGLHIEKSAPCR